MLHGGAFAGSRPSHLSDDDAHGRKISSRQSAGPTLDCLRAASEKVFFSVVDSIFVYCNPPAERCGRDKSWNLDPQKCQAENAGIRCVAPAPPVSVSRNACLLSV